MHTTEIEKICHMFNIFINLFHLESRIRNCSWFIGQGDATFGGPIGSTGQLILKCPYEKSVSSKIPTKIFLDFCPEIFLQLSGGFLEAFMAFWGHSK